MALALLTRMSMPPNFATAAWTAAWIWSSDLTSTTQARARPPAFSISSATEWIVPGSLGCASAVLAATTTFAPSRAARSPMALPIPRLAPVMKSVLPFSVDMGPALRRLSSRRAAALVKQNVAQRVRESANELALPGRPWPLGPQLRYPPSPPARRPALGQAVGSRVSPVPLHARHIDRSERDRPRKAHAPTRIL